MPVEVPCNFVGSFKVGDNLVFNADILCRLVDANLDGILNKPIVLQVGAILEAALSQIIYRAQHYNREGVPNISEVDRREIEGKKIDKFSAVINVLRKYNILNNISIEIYDELHRLMKYRNKIHIQDNMGDGLPVDELDAFSDRQCEWALRLNLQVLQYLNENFSRPAYLADYVRPLHIPNV